MWNLFFQVNNSFNLSPALVNKIEVLSSLQIIYLILKSMMTSAQIHRFSFLGSTKSSSFIFAIPQFKDTTMYNIYLQPLWIFCVIYLILMLLQATVILIISRIKYQSENPLIKRFSQVLDIMYFLHSRVLFFPVQFFFFELLHLINNKDIENLFYTKENLFITIIVMSLINLSLASLKEIFFFQPNQTKNPYGAKTNIYHQLILTYKILALLLDYFSYTTGNLVLNQITSIIHVVLTPTLISILYKRLPFYRFRVLKTAIIMTSIMFSLSLVLVLQAFNTDSLVFSASEILLLIVPALITKATLIFFKSLFESILRGKVTSAAHAIHFILLFKELKKNILTPTLIDRGFLPSIHSLIGALKQLGIDNIKNLTDQAIQKQSKVELYKHITDRLEYISSSFDKTPILKLFLAQVYLKRLRNAPRAIDLIRRVELQQPSHWVRNAIKAFYLDLTKVYAEEYLESNTQTQLNIYFKCDAIGKSLQKDIQQEIDHYLVFWSSIQKNDFDVKKVVQTAEEIDKLAIKIQRQYEMSSEDFRKSFKLPILMYAVYLNNLRQLSNEGQDIMKKYRMTISDANHNELFDSDSGKIAIVIVSLNKQNAGEILEVSGSIKDLFGLNKEDLVKKSFDCLFPPIIGKSYYEIIQYYSRTLTFKLNYKGNTYGKTVAGDLFELEAHFQLYPYLNREITMMILLKKVSEPKIFFIANHEGTILDHSKNIGKSLNVHGIDLIAFKTIQDISSEFEQINTALNLVCREERAYGFQIEQENRESASSRQNENKIIDTAIDFLLQVQKDNKANVNQVDYYAAKASRAQSMQKETLTIPRSFRNALVNKVKQNSKVSLKNLLTTEEARELCHKFIQGHNIILDSLMNLAKSNVKLQAHAKIRVCSLGGEIYKILALSKIVGEKTAMALSPRSPCLLEPQTFNEMGIILPTSERNLITQTETFSQFQKLNSLRKKERNTTKERSKDIDTEETGRIKLIQFEKKPRKKEAKVKEERELSDGQKSSVMGVHSRESKIAKTLQDITKRRKMSPLVKMAILVVYFVLLCMFTLVGVNYQLSRNSIQEIEKGVRIVNIATERLQDSLRMWQWSLFLYLSETKLQYYPPYLVQAFVMYLRSDCKESSKHNSQLKNELSLIKDKELIQDSFSKEIKMWTPSNWVGVSYEEVDPFIANDILVNQYSAIAYFSSRSLILKTDHAIYAFNNTGNDYIICAKKIISATEDLLQRIVTKNLTSLYLIAAFEHLVLFMLLVALVILCIVNSRLYNRLFKALSRVQERSISSQIGRIQKIKALFEEDIEMAQFSENALNLYEKVKREQGSKMPSKNAGSKDKTFSMKKMNWHLLKFGILGSLFIPLLVLLFDLSLVELAKMFKSFENINNQISLLSQASYQGELALNALATSVAFYNYTSIRIFNQPSWDQVMLSVQQFQDINEKLTTLILNEEERYFETVIESILKNNVCEFLDDSVQEDCEVATKGNNMGLISLNNHYIQVIIDCLTAFAQNTTLANVKDSLDLFQIYATSDLVTIKNIYSFIVDYLLDAFEKDVSDNLADTLWIFLGLCGVILVYTVYIQIVCLNKIIKIDMSRRKVLKVIPFSMIQENKVLSFYLLKDFQKEMESVRNLL